MAEQPEKRAYSLEHDNRHLYYCLGALTDAIDQLPELHRKQVLQYLETKIETCPADMRDTLINLMEAMKK